MTAPTLARPLAAACVLGLAGAAAHAQPSFHLLGIAPGAQSSSVTSFSDDGRIAFGRGDGGTSGNFPRSFRYTRDTGRVDLSNPPDMLNFGGFMSADGTTIVGTGLRTDRDTVSSFRRVGDQPWELIPTLPGWDYLAISGVSRDGNIIVGTHDSGDFQFTEAAIWTPQTGTRRLVYPQFAQYTEARGVSKDGQIVVGNADVPGDAQAWSWNAEDGFRQLPGLPGIETFERAYATNEDGSVIVGGIDVAGPQRMQAAIWRNEVPSLLPIPSGFQRSDARSVSGDGSIVVGFLQGTTSFLDTSFIWSPSTGTMVLEDYLRGLGFAIPSDARISAATISSDGSTIGGGMRYRVNGVERFEAFIAVIPGPSTFLIFAPFGLAAHRRRARMS